MLNHRNNNGDINHNNDVIINIDEVYDSKKKKKVKFRKRIFEIIEVAKPGDYVSLVYDMIVITSVIVSLIPLAFSQKYLQANEQVKRLFNYIEMVVTVIFIIDYIFRIMTADYKFNNKSIWSFIKYPFTIRAIIDLVSILPSITLVYEQLRLVRIFTLIKTLKIIRVFKTFRYSKSINIISGVIKNSKQPLIAVGTLSIGYVLISALIIFNVEEDTFENFFIAVYWATVSLTTVGYGDIYPSSTWGRVISMISSVFGIALVALPAGIITAGYMDSLNKILEKDKNSPDDHLSSTSSYNEENYQNYTKEQEEKDISNYSRHEI